MNEVVVKADLLDKMHPRRVRSSGKMHFIISTILGQDWVTNDRASGGFSVTSDGFVVSGGLFLGSVDDFERNVVGYCEVVGLTEDEAALFCRLYQAVVSDWQRGFGDGRDIYIPFRQERIVHMIGEEVTSA